LRENGERPLHKIEKGEKRRLLDLLGSNCNFIQDYNLLIDKITRAKRLKGLANEATLVKKAKNKGMGTVDEAGRVKLGVRGKKSKNLKMESRIKK